MDHTHDDDLLELEPLPEGEEAPPPHVRTMAIVRWIILGAMSLFAVGMVLGGFGLAPWSQAAAKVTQYHCPMHPTYISDQPGECPICGMTLVPINSKDSVVSDTASATRTPGAAVDSAILPKPRPGQYYCPMDPEVISDTAGRCPVCGMKLVKYEPDSSKATSAHSPDDMAGMPGMPGMAETPDTTESTVPGLVEVTLEPRRLQLIGVRTGFVERSTHGATVTTVGYVTADETKVRSVSVRVSGWIRALYVDQTGQQVSAGQPLLKIYSQDLYQAEQDYLVALEGADHATVDADLTRMRKQLVSSGQERLRLLGLTADQIAAIEKSRKADPEFTLESPFSGAVMAKNVNAGQYVTPDQNLLTIADLRSVYVVADLYEDDLAKVHVGDKAELTLADSKIGTIEGVVSLVYPSVAGDTRTGRVRIDLANPKLALLPGMYASVTFRSEGHEGLWVSSDAVMDGGKIKYAFVVRDGIHFEPRRVTTGQTTDDQTEILSGLSQGQEVVTSANFLIDSESRLKAAISGMSGDGMASGHNH